jgi:hypothetical protein
MLLPVVVRNSPEFQAGPHWIGFTQRSCTTVRLDARLALSSLDLHTVSNSLPHRLSRREQGVKKNIRSKQKYRSPNIYNTTIARTRKYIRAQSCRCTDTLDEKKTRKEKLDGWGPRVRCYMHNRQISNSCRKHEHHCIGRSYVRSDDASSGKGYCCEHRGNHHVQREIYRQKIDEYTHMGPP